MSTICTAADEARLRAAIVAQARTWLRTPYHHQADILGAGVDCLMLLVRVYAAVGLVPADLDPRPYPVQWHLHRSEERYLAGLERYAVPTRTPRPGDVLVWPFGRAYSHAGIASAVDAVTEGADGALQVHGRVIHALRDARQVVETGTLDAPLAGRAVRCYTMFAEA